MNIPADAAALQGTTVAVSAMYAAECPACGAGAGQRCRGPYGPMRPSQWHKTRADAVRSSIPTHEQHAPPPPPHRNHLRPPTFGEHLPAPQTWEQWQESRDRGGDQP
jgi:hypothetical protein